MFRKKQMVELWGPTQKYTSGCINPDAAIDEANKAERTVSIGEMTFCMDTGNGISHPRTKIFRQAYDLPARAS